MANIDDKVVAMSFENSKFEAGVSQTISTLDKLKAALHFPGASKGLDELGNVADKLKSKFHFKDAAKGLDEISSAAKRVDISHIGHGVDAVVSKLSYLSVAALSIFSHVANAAFQSGLGIAKAFSFEPVTAGYGEYVTKINAIQTILSNTAAAGTTLADVSKALAELNEYSDKTIYNFGQMARNIGTFTAAGVELDVAVDAIKGIANLAALSGSSALQASTAMYQLSQAVANGKVAYIDWISVNNAGMGGAVFQRALAQTAVAMGTLKDEQLKLVGPMKNVTIAGQSFKNSLSGKGTDGWLSSKVLTATLAQFTGDLSDAELAAQGFTGQQIHDIQKLAKASVLAATQVKDFFNVMSVAKETAGSGWSESFEIILGTYTEAKTTFTNLSNTINGFINRSADARNKVLGDWKALGGRRVLINSIKTAFENLMAILGPIKSAFRDIFPAQTAKDLFTLTYHFKHFAESLKASPETIENLKRTFRGLFAILSIGVQIISGIFTVFKTLFGAVGEGSGSFLNFTGNIGDFLVSLDAALKKGDRFHNFFVAIGNVLRAPIDLLRAIGTALSDLFAGFSPGEFFGQVDGMGQKLSPLQSIIEGIATAWGWVLDVIGGSGKAIRPAVDAVIDMVKNLVPAISGATGELNFDAILAVIRTGFLGGLLIMFKRFLGKGSILEQLAGKGGIFGNIRRSFKIVTGSMVDMQTNIKADTLKKIAIAIGILTLSVVALSMIDPKKLASALTAMTIGFGQLVGAMAILEKVSKGVGFLKMPFITASLIALAVAIDLLVIAVVALSLLSWEDLLKGLGGVSVLLGGLVLAVKPLSAGSAGMIRAGIGIAAIAGSLVLLATAVRIMGTMNLVDLAKGLVAIAAGLVLLIFALPDDEIVPLRSSVGLIALAGALVLLATAVRIMGSMDLQELGKGLAGMAAGLIMMVFALQNMPGKSMLRNAAALILMAGAVRVLAESIVMMGGMSIKELATGLIGLGGALAIMAGALYLMSGAVPGAIALGIAAAGIAVLAPAIMALGKQSWGQMLKGMIALGGALAVIAGAALLLSPALPAMAGLGLTLLGIGAGLALAGVGLSAIAWGLAALLVSLPAGVGILIAALVELIKGLIDNAKLLALGLLEVLTAFADVAPEIVDQFVKIVNSLVDGLIEVIPKMITAADAMLTGLLTFLTNNTDRLVQAGLDLFIGLLTGVRNNIGRITIVVSDIIVNFLNALTSNLNKIIVAGTNLLIAFIRGIANSHSRIVTAVIDIIQKFITSIATKLGGLPAAGLKILTKLLTGIKDNLKDVIKAAGDVITAFIKEIGAQAERVVKTARETAGKFVRTLAKEIVALADELYKALIDLINGMADVIEDNQDEMEAAGMHLAWAIIDGMTFGLAGKAQTLYNKADEIARTVLGKLKAPLKIFNPSAVTMGFGAALVEGMSRGMDDNAKHVYSSATTVGNGVITSFKDTLGIASPSRVMEEIGKAVGQGFAKGITGSADDIQNAFVGLNETLLNAMRDARETIATEQDNLRTMLKEKDEKLAEVNAKKFKKESERAKALAEIHEDYKKPIKAAQAVIKENESILKRTTAANLILMRTLKTQKKELIGLAKDFDRVTKELEEAKNALVEVTQARDDIFNQYSAKPEISDKMTEEIKDGRKAIKAEQDKLADILADKVETDAKLAENIEAANVKIAKAQAKLNIALTVKAKETAQKLLDAEKDKLKKLVETKDGSVDKIEEANLAIIAAQVKFDEMIEGKVLNKEGTEIDQLATYMLALKNQISAVSAYAATLEQLRNLGIDRETYDKLVKEGTADQSFADALLRGGKTAVDGLNTLDKQLATESLKLANKATNYLFPAGVAAAQGIVKGLESELENIRKMMDKIGALMISTLNKKLKKKSPSEEFANIGKFSMMGLAKGFTDSKKIVRDAIDDAAQDALNTMRRNMRYISEAVTEDLNPNPVITPILDLTVVRSQAKELATLTATESLGHASVIASAQIAAEAAETLTATAGTSITYEQNNYSPKALTNIEIYRNTRNQLSQLKSVLAT